MMNESSTLELHREKGFRMETLRTRARFLFVSENINDKSGLWAIAGGRINSPFFVATNID